MAPVPDMFLDEELARDLDSYHTKHNFPGSGIQVMLASKHTPATG